MNKENMNKECLNKENINKESLNKKNMNKKNMNKKNMNKESLNKKSMNKENMNKESLNKENMNKESLNKENMNKENMNKESFNKKRIYKKSMNKKNISTKINIKKYIDKKVIIKKKYKKRKLFFYKNILKIKLFKIKNKLIINNKTIRIYERKLIFTEIKNRVKFCVFAGREKNIKILHYYIEKLLEKKIIDEYHIFNFTRNINDYKYLKEEYDRLSNKYEKKIYIHNLENKFIERRNKTDWSNFYKNLMNMVNDQDVIIKCDDDILFIDIYSLKNAIEDRIRDKYSFIIHSNCINNGVCVYYQKHLYKKLEEQLSIYPTGGIMGILFEKPEMGYVIHKEFCKDILEDINNIKKYIIEDIYIDTRISINFILINGEDVKYLKDITSDDEYMISSFIPEKLLRPNKIKGDLITSHLSYSIQEKIILYNDNILNEYKKIKEKYDWEKDININYNNYKIPKLNNSLMRDIYKVKNIFNEKNYYIKNKETGLYLSIEYEKNIVNLSSKNRTIFEITNLENNIIEIKLGIYYITNYNILGEFRNENIFFKYFKDESEKYIIKEKVDEESFYLKFKKHNNYICFNKNNKICLDNKLSNLLNCKWILERVIINDKYIEYKRFNEKNKFYYINIKNNEIYTNHYLGWGINNLLI
jgi:hypothetical protein